MDQKYRNTAVENLVESLSFEVEAVPQDNVPQYKSTSHITPVNVKVRVRKKDKSGMQKGTICIPKVARTENHPERIRLASSDQTIMSFNVLMEDPDNRKTKKKNVFGGCLNGTTDDDDGPYMPTEEASGSKSGHKQKLALSKNVGNQLVPGDVQRKPKKFFGPCKPGGCLDPPFGEDRYPYFPPDTKKPSTDHEIDPKVPVDERKTSESPPTNNEIETGTPESPIFGNKIDEKKPKLPSSDSTTEKKLERCPKKDDTCPPFNYKVDPATIPLPFIGFGSAAPGSKEGPETFDENETSTRQRKRKVSSSDSPSKVKLSKRISGVSSSAQSVSKGEKIIPPLEDKESNSIITYAGDEDDIDSERLNRNRKSSANTNRTSFDLNAPYYSKRDSRDKDKNEKTEKLRRSIEPLGKAQDDFFPDERDKQRRILRMGMELRDEDAVSVGENGQSKRKMDDNITNTKYLKRPSLQKSQDNGIDKLNTAVEFPLGNTRREVNEGGVVSFLSPDDNDKTNPNTYDKDQVGTRESISKNFDQAIEIHKLDDTFTVDNENTKGFDEKNQKYVHSSQSNSHASGNKPRSTEDGFYTYSENDTEDLKHKLGTGMSEQDMNLQKDFYIKQTESSNKIFKPSQQSEKYINDYFGHVATDQNDINTLQASPKGNQKSEYTESTTDSKSWQADKEAQRYSFEKLNSKDIVTLKSGAFYKEMSDAESDSKVTDSRSSLVNKKYNGIDNIATVETETDKDLKSLIKTPITKTDINSKDKLYDIDITASNSHRVSSVSPEYSDGYLFELGNADFQNKDTGIRKSEEMLVKTGKGSNIHTGIQKYEEMLEKTDKGSNLDIMRTRKYDEMTLTTNTDIGTRKYNEMSAKIGSGSNTDIRTQKYAEKIGNVSKTGSGSNINIRSRNYDEMSARRTGESSNKLANDISLDLAFQNSYNGNVRVLKTLETPLDSKMQADPNIFLIQKRISLDGEKTQVLIDSDTNMSIQLNRHSVDSHHEKDHNIHKGILISDEHATHSHHHHHQHTHPHVTFSSEHLHENLSYLYEKELVPLQNMIKSLKAEIDALAGQHKRRERTIQQRLRPVGHCGGIIIKK